MRAGHMESVTVRVVFAVSSDGSLRKPAIHRLMQFLAVRT